MNKKGFAISIILYSIIFLIITMLFILLAIMRTRFNVNNELRENIRETINDEINAGSLFPSSEHCKITGNTSGYTDNLILTNNVTYNGSYDSSHTNGKLYSWDNEVYSTNNTIKVNRKGVYTGYFKDNVGGSGSCEIEIVSKTQYGYRDCVSARYGEWYEYGSESYASSCPTNIKSKAEAENSNLDTYSICEESTSSECGSLSPCYRLKNYKRNMVGCDVWNGWSHWSDTQESSSITREVRSSTTYKIKTS